MQKTPSRHYVTRRSTYGSRFPFLTIGFLFTFFASSSFAQGTDIAIGTTTLQPSVKRLGINLGTEDYWDSGQTTQNLVSQNPGFEGQIWNSTIRCQSGTTTTCVDEDQWAGWPAGFWNGATFEIFYGAAAGRTGTVSYSSAPGNGVGLTLYFSGSGVAPASGDYLIVRKSVSGLAAGGWWPAGSGNGTVTDNLTDLPPGTLGKQTVALSAPTASDSATLGGYFDTVAGKTFLQLNGSYQLQFKAKGTGGSNSVSLLVSRGGVATYLNQTVTLSTSWNTYTIPFNAAENGSAIGNAQLVFATVGADSFELDDVSLTQTNGDPTNTTAFRDGVVSALRTLQPGVLRYWSGQLGDTLDNLLTPQFGRQRSGYLAWYTESYQIDYGLHEFLALCQATGAEPWFVVPSTFSTTDASNLIQYLGGSTSTTYGAKRAALGQTTPWTQVFSKIHLEFGNEAWNSGFKGGSIEYSAPYGSRAQTIFGVMRANSAYVASNFDLVLGGQSAWAARNTDIQNNCNNNDSFAVAPYTMGTVDSYSDIESLYGSTFAEPEAYVSSTGTAEGETPGQIYQDYGAMTSSSRPTPLSFYEVNLSTLGGSITQSALNSYTPSLGAGLMVADTMLLSLRQFGVVNQALFALPQYDFIRQDGKTALLWGSVVDMGVTNRKRPQFLALQVANNALSNGASMLQTIHTGADPTWNQPLVNTVQFSGAHFLHSFAFANGSSHSAIVFNLSRNASLPVTFSGANAPSGTVQMQQLTSANPSDTNENANVVNIASSTLSGFNPSYGLTLPPYSMTVLVWSGQSVSVNIPAPVISGVNAGSVTSSGATITWNTDQAASSQAQYGTALPYGSSSAVNSSLTATHSVTLNGLLANTTYDYNVVSTNSSGNSSSSSNYTFTTAANQVVNSAAPPQLSYVASWGITTNSITISWSTNKPATSAVAYGPTSSLGQMSSTLTSLSSNHGITLTGLKSGTTYYFVAQSADSNGNLGYSSVFTATTTSSSTTTTASTTPPQVAYVVPWGITDSGATISWSTNEPANASLAFGTTTSLGSISPTDSSVVLSHGVTLTGLKSGTTYYFVAQSTDANGNTGYSTISNFTTAASKASGTLVSASSASALTTAVPAALGPQVSYIASWGITNSGITISWSTNEPSTTALGYGTTSSLGQLTPVQSALTTTHGVTLSGLSGGTTYYFVAQSTDASGNTGYSGIFSFTTINNASPAISGILAVPGNGNQAQIYWTTSVPTSSYVRFGLTTNYTCWSALTPLTTTPQPIIVSVPSGVVHYQLVSTDAFGNQAVSPDYTFVEP